MDAKLAFHRAFKHYGPPVTDQNLKLVGLDHVVNDLRNINSEIFCGYIDKQEFNAIAALHSDIELVGFFAGLTHYLFFYFDTLLSDPNVFPDIGDRSKEKLDQSRIESFRNPFLSLHSVRALARPPICEIRAQVARDLVTCAHYFIFAHEVGHLQMCHLRLLRDDFGVQEYEELPIVVISEKEARIRIGLEILADQSATFTSLHWWRIAWNNGPLKNHQGLDADTLWSIAVMSIFIIFEYIRHSKQEGVIRTHPTPFQRLVSLELCMSSKERAKVSGLEPLKQSAHPTLVSIPIMKWWMHNDLFSGSRRMFEEGYDQIMRDKVVKEFADSHLSEEYLDKLAVYQKQRGRQSWNSAKDFRNYPLDDEFYEMFEKLKEQLRLSTLGQKF